MKLGSILYLSRRDVEAIQLPMQEIIDALDEMFKEKGRGKVEMPPKPGIHTQPDAFIHAMPAYIPSLQAAGVKWVSGYPANQAKGLPYITGLLILNDPETGVPLAVMDCTWITAKRLALPQRSLPNTSPVQSAALSVLSHVACKGAATWKHWPASSRSGKLKPTTFTLTLRSDMRVR